MSKLTFGIIFVLFLLFLASGRPCAAQNANQCMGLDTWWFGDPIPQGWFYYAPYPGTFVYWIAAETNTCHPPCNCPRSTPTVGHPISLGNGDTFIEQEDVKIPGLGGGLRLSRTWNSVWPMVLAAQSTGVFGPDWRSTYEELIVMGGDHYLRYLRGDGTFWVFGWGSSGTFVVASPANIAATLVAGTSSWTLTFQNGEQRQFSLATGQLTAIIDRNGNTTQISYDNLNRLITVTSAASQHLYFNYQTGSNLISSVTSDFGVTFSYAYDTNNRLIQVTRPDQTTISYTYNAQSQITQVTDSNGIVLESHTYDANNRGLTSAQANNVNAVSITYVQ